MADDDNTAPSNNDDNTELEEEDLTPDESTASEVFTTPDVLTAYKNYHTDLRIIIPPHLNVSGLLLTISFGAMYFIIKDSKNIPIQFPKCILYLLFFIIFLLAVSILLGILSIYLRPIPMSLETGGLTELAYHSKIYKIERICSVGATGTLIFAILLIIVSLSMFAYQENSIGVALEKENNSSNDINIYITSNNSSLDTEAYTINISRHRTSNIAPALPRSVVQREQTPKRIAT